ncbi:MAG TPA: chloride channel protein [Ignavibacteriaceae bacterium]|nr:chloride channel protein [Ignavibacteriaceae bacterium]
MTEHTFMIVIAIIIGVLAGFSAIGIRAMIKFFSNISFPGPGNLLQNIMDTPWLLILIIPIIGGLIVGPIIHFLAPEAKGHGVPEVMQAILLKGGQIRGRVAFVKAVASAISIGTGGSVGREGPIIQIGSSLGSVVGQFLRVSPKRLKTLVGCGAAAGIAAAFNAPIAGALFAVEIVLMDFAVAQFSPIVISSVMATVISHYFEGNFAAFIVPKYQLASPVEIGFYFILGAASGLVAYLFIKTLYYCEEIFDNRIKIPESFKPALGGLGIGIIALAFPQVMGVGYDSINNALYGNMIWYVALILIFMKILATSLTLGSGGSGGIFAPSLFMGAMLGYFFGTIVHNVFPDITASPGAYALVAMGGLVAGTTRAPITAIIIVFELTNDYHIILPLMITCIISMILSSKLSRESIYTLKLVLRNIGLKEGMETNVMESIYVKNVYRKEFESILVTDNFSQIVNRIIRGKEADFPVVDSEGHVSGMISIHDIKDYLYERESLQNLLIAGDILNPYFESLLPGDSCQTALDKFRKFSFDGLPVVEDSNSGKIIGIIWRKDIQDSYDREIERRELTSNLASLITMKDEEPMVHFMEGYSIIEVSPPKSFIGKSIRELNIRRQYGVDVLSIKMKEKKGEKINAIPSPDYIIKADDTLIIAGEIKNINFIRNLG